MFCGEIISNFVDSSEYDDKSRLYMYIYDGLGSCLGFFLISE